MTKVIDGKKYSTETATEVAEFYNTHDRSNFSHYSETLYITPKGNWFVQVDGGPLTTAAVHNGNETSGSCYLEAYSPEEALEWLSEHADGDTVAKYFPDDIEDA